MRVKELIEKLKEFDENLEVFYSDTGYGLENIFPHLVVRPPNEYRKEEARWVEL